MNGKAFLAMGKVTLEDYNELLIELEEYIKEFLEDKEIEKNKFTSMQWAACLMYLYRHTFRVNPRYLFRTNRSSQDLYNYDIFKVNKVLDIYLYLCYIYSFRICIDHFCYFTGINTETIYRWKYDNRTLYIDTDSDLCTNRESISNINIDSTSNTYQSSNSSIDNADSNDNIYSSSVNSSSNVYSSNIDIDSVNLSSNIYTGIVDNIELTIKPSNIYNRLVKNTITAADDIMLSKHGVNSIAYRNMINERYSNKIQDNVPVLEMSDLAKQLGISKELDLLPDKDKV